MSSWKLMVLLTFFTLNTLQGAISALAVCIVFAWRDLHMIQLLNVLLCCVVTLMWKWEAGKCEVAACFSDAEMMPYWSIPVSEIRFFQQQKGWTVEAEHEHTSRILNKLEEDGLSLRRRTCCRLRGWPLWIKARVLNPKSHSRYFQFVLSVLLSVIRSSFLFFKHFH